MYQIKIRTEPKTVRIDVRVCVLCCFVIFSHAVSRLVTICAAGTADARFEHMSFVLPSFRINVIEHILLSNRTRPAPTAENGDASAVRVDAKASPSQRPLFSPPLLIATPRRRSDAELDGRTPPRVQARQLLSIKFGGMRMFTWRCSDRTIDEPFVAWRQARSFFVVVNERIGPVPLSHVFVFRQILRASAGSAGLSGRLLQQTGHVAFASFIPNIATFGTSLETVVRLRRDIRFRRQPLADSKH